MAALMLNAAPFAGMALGMAAGMAVGLASVLAFNVGRR